jgi:hypothetical protein
LSARENVEILKNGTYWVSSDQRGVQRVPRDVIKPGLFSGPLNAIGRRLGFHKLHNDVLEAPLRFEAACEPRVYAAFLWYIWPAAGSVDTEIGCLRKPEASDAEAQV